MNIFEITDFGDTALDIYARKNERELMNGDKPGQGIFIAESPKVINRALDAGYEPVSALVEDKVIEKEKQTLSRLGDIPVYVAGIEVLKELTGYMLTSGMLCAMRRKNEYTLDSIMNGSKRIAVLERIMNPTNAGAIFRNAAALNIDAVILTEDCTDPLYRRCIRVSMGTVFQIPWVIAPGDIVLTETLKNKGFTTCAFALRNSNIDINDPVLKSSGKIALFLGSEGDGLSEKTIEQCDYTVKIPMRDGVDSLNVAAASAVAFWAIGER